MREVTFIANLLIILHIFSYTHEVFAWNDKVTHADMSEYAAQSSVLDKSKGDYLSNLGFNRGLDETFKWSSEKTVKKWLREGAILEDSGNYWEAVVNYARYNNHFHDPLKAWSSAGLTDLVPFSTESAIIWAQDGNYQSSFPEGDWSWKKVREYYHIALTGRNLSGTEVALAKEDRDVYFAKTFRGLGHQMHLIEDIAQPDHVRNDSHIVDSLLERNLYGSYYLETWASKNPTVINSLAANPVLPSVSFDTSHNGLVPITQLIDADQYDGSSPSTSLLQGLAEYTNADFFSDDTIFAAERYSAGDEHYFPYPKRSSTDLDAYISGTKPPETIIDEDGNEYTNTWISKVADGETIDHFIAPSYLTDLTYYIFGEGSLYYSTFYRDEKCHEDYATQLIPKAVGYSAGLLNYFFRGELKVVRNSNSNSITITNNSSEDMDGTFTLYYDASDDTRKSVSDGSWSIVLEAGSSSNELNFTEPTDLGEDNRYILVFEGTLGSESNAVVGKNMLPTKLFAGGVTRGRIFDFDGTTWVFNVTLPAATQIYSLGVFQNKLYAGTWPGGQVFVTDDGVLWSLSISSVGGEGFCFTFEEFNGALYSGVGMSPRIFHINKFDGVSWISHTALPNTRSVRALKVYNGKLYAATEGNYVVDVSGQVYVYNGIAWSLSKDFAPDPVVKCLEVFDNKLYAGTDGAQLGVFDGATWSIFTPFGAATEVYTLKVYNGKLYAGTDNNRIFVSDDGIIWLESNIFMETQVRSLEIYRGKLYAGVNSSGKVYVFDGSTWALSGTLSTTSILSLKTR
ncbi:MAG: hypothetical protein U0586_09275 [Candidatus Brocadiaceae bacterium]